MNLYINYKINILIIRFKVSKLFNKEQKKEKKKEKRKCKSRIILDSDRDSQNRSWIGSCGA